MLRLPSLLKKLHHGQLTIAVEFAIYLAVLSGQIRNVIMEPFPEEVKFSN